MRRRQGTAEKTGEAEPEATKLREERISSPHMNQRPALGRVPRDRESLILSLIKCYNRYTALSLTPLRKAITGLRSSVSKEEAVDYRSNHLDCGWPSRLGASTA